MIVTINVTSHYLFTKLGRQYYGWTWEAVNESGQVIGNSRENPDERMDDEGHLGKVSEWYEEFDAYEAGRAWALSLGHIVKEDEDMLC